MKILFVVQPLQGDKIDANHVRVEDHHSGGLTYTDVLIDGVVREIRSTSAIDRSHPVTKTRTILVHLKSLPQYVERIKGSDLSTSHILMCVKNNNSWPSLTEYRQRLARPDFSGTRLFKRKQQMLVRKGYVKEDRGVPFITDEGLKLLGISNAN